MNESDTVLLKGKFKLKHLGRLNLAYILPAPGIKSVSNIFRNSVTFQTIQPFNQEMPDQEPAVFLLSLQSLGHKYLLT